MRVIIIGQGAFAVKTLQALLKKEENVVAAYIPPDIPGSPVDPMKETAVANRIPVY